VKRFAGGCLRIIWELLRQLDTYRTVMEAKFYDNIATNTVDLFFENT
jgi:hypothetical protein